MSIKSTKLKQYKEYNATLNKYIHLGQIIGVGWLFIFRECLFRPLPPTPKKKYIYTPNDKKKVSV